MPFHHRPTINLVVLVVPKSLLVNHLEGPIRQPERGGSEWEPIKILLEGD
jgi:hypothetical protein